MAEMITTKSFVLPDGKASIICPECKSQKFISTKTFARRAHQAKTKCKCGCQFKVFFEFRKNFRKPVNLTGECTFTHCSEVVVRLLDLSMGGTCIEALTDCDISNTNKGVIKFTLDDNQKSVITKKLTVLVSSGTKKHCKFFKDKEYERELGFYLRT